MEVISCHAMAFSDEVPTDLLLELFSDFQLERGEEHALKATGEGRKRLFLYRYRVFVLVGFSELEIAEYRERIPELLGKPPFYLEEDDFEIINHVQQPTVKFDSVELSRWNEDLVQILAQVLGRSTALSIVEREVNALIEDSSSMAARFKDPWFFGRNRRKAHEHLQEVYHIRHRLIMQLALLRSPDLVWEDEQSEKVYKRLVENFDIADRLEGVEKMLELSSDVARFQLEVMHMRRSELLEIIIILLILVEVVHTFVPLK